MVFTKGTFCIILSMLSVIFTSCVKESDREFILKYFDIELPAHMAVVDSTIKPGKQINITVKVADVAVLDGLNSFDYSKWSDVTSDQYFVSGRFVIDGSEISSPHLFCRKLDDPMTLLIYNQEEQILHLMIAEYVEGSIVAE